MKPRSDAGRYLEIYFTGFLTIWFARDNLALSNKIGWRWRTARSLAHNVHALTSRRSLALGAPLFRRANAIPPDTRNRMHTMRIRTPPANSLSPIERAYHNI